MSYGNTIDVMLRHTHMHTPNQGRDDDTLSVYVFGEEEEGLYQEALNNNGYIGHRHLQKHYGRREIEKVRVFTIAMFTYLHTAVMHVDKFQCCVIIYVHL